MALLAGASAARAEPAAAAAMRGWTGPFGVARVVAPLELELTDGRHVLVAGIVVPDVPAADETWRRLAALVGKDTLWLGQGITDRHGRIAASLDDGVGQGLQAALVAEGLALAAPRADLAALSTELLARESEAAAMGLGLWADPGRVVCAAERAGECLDRYALVEGRVAEVGRGQEFLYLNFGADWRDDFTLRLPPGRLRGFAAAGLEPEGLVGRIVRARGWVFDANGPMIELVDPAQVEVLP